MTQRLLGAGLALFGIAVIVLATQLPQPLAATRIAYGPGFFPLLLGAVITAAGGWLAVFGPGQAIDEVEAERYEFKAFIKPAIVCTAALAYVLFSQQVGFLVLAPIILISLLLLGRIRPLTSVFIGIVTVILVYVVFAKLLLVPLPLGVLSSWGAYL